ncbi:hypothetical protein EK21DRAFT_91286 [Setomelanomma holmii]|uniref:Uncharacterized protein n=1 Tax=Setomelanomma holmii TaxID=210430 RepID=A0A9P4H3X5_9PLEO|nr:hypothetical protein EK21DRAFT_91286 [Setomelanomma holmii]
MNSPSKGAASKTPSDATLEQYRPEETDGATAAKQQEFDDANTEDGLVVTAGSNHKALTEVLERGDYDHSPSKDIGEDINRLSPCAKYDVNTATISSAERKVLESVVKGKTGASKPPQDLTMRPIRERERSEAACSKSEAAPQAGVKHRPKTPKSAADGLVLPKSVLPEFSTLTLAYNNYDNANRAATDVSIAWSPPENDSTVPTTDVKRQEYVLRLLLAFRNVESLQNAGRGNVKRWNSIESVEKHYGKGSMEKACWDILHNAERLHNEGPSFVRIYDPVILKNIEKDSHLSFEERIRHLVKLLCFYKSKCEDVMKPGQLEDIVASPRTKLQNCKENKKNNTERSEMLAKGREVKKAAKEAQDRNAPTTKSAGDDDDGEDEEAITVNDDTTILDHSGIDDKTEQEDTDKDIDRASASIFDTTTSEAPAATSVSAATSAAVPAIKRKHNAIAPDSGSADDTEHEPKRVYVE